MKITKTKGVGEVFERALEKIAGDKKAADGVEKKPEAKPEVKKDEKK